MKFIDLACMAHLLTGKAELIYENVLGDYGENAYSPRSDFNRPKELVPVEYDGSVNLKRAADDMGACIHSDPALAAQVAKQLLANNRPIGSHGTILCSQDRGRRSRSRAES